MSYIFGLIEDFERKHGRRPQLICLTARHMHLLMTECPDLFHKDTAIPLGFRILILPEMELSHPKAVWLPPRQRKPQRSASENGPALITLTARRHKRREG